jgi:hypothetical protein
MMRSYGLLLGLALAAAAVPAKAQPRFDQPRRSVGADRETRIRTVFNCRNDVIGGVSGTAQHGTVTTRPGKQRRCGTSGRDVVEVFYRPQPGYRGPDDVQIYWGRGGRIYVHLNVR